VACAIISTIEQKMWIPAFAGMTIKPHSVNSEQILIGIVERGYLLRSTNFKPGEG
jgi:hypothetical protein